MGGGSSSNASSNTTNNVDTSVNLNDGGFVAQDGSSINITDGGSVQAALDFSQVALVESMDFAENSLTAISKSNTQNVSAVKQLAENLKANETSTGQKMDRLMMYGVIALIVIVLLIVLVPVLRGKK